jgi:hypothetical protein
MALMATSPRRRGPRATSRRAFRHAGRLPEQPLGVEVLAAVARARQRAGREHPWDARLEASLLAVHGYLWRRGRGEKWAGVGGSARYGCSVAQLVFGLAPIMGWTHIPATRDHAGRVRFVKRHRKSVQRWLAWLEFAGLVVHTPQQDEEGFWWRTIIELHATPALDPDLLAAARRRRLGWRAAEQRRRARGRRRDLTVILQRARLTRAQRRARAMQHRTRLREHHARVRVRELLARSLADAASEHLTHPSGAATTCRRSPEADTALPTLVRRHERARSRVPHTILTAEAHNNRAPNETPRSREDQRWAVYREVSAVRWSRSQADWQPATAALARRVAELQTWPEPRTCPRWRVVEAWALAVHGPWLAVAGAARLALWSEQRPHHGARLDRALERYRRFVHVRPPGFPTGPVAALAHFFAHHTTAQDGAERGMAYDVQRFNELTKQMSAYAHITAPENAARAAARVRRRATARAIAEQTNLRVRFRLDRSSQLRTARELLDSPHPAHRAAGRQLAAGAQRAADARKRDARVLAGRDPWPLDGRYRLAARYAARWDLPTPHWQPDGDRSAEHEPPR